MHFDNIKKINCKDCLFYNIEDHIHTSENDENIEMKVRFCSRYFSDFRETSADFLSFIAKKGKKQEQHHKPIVTIGLDQSGKCPDFALQSLAIEQIQWKKKLIFLKRQKTIGKAISL